MTAALTVALAFVMAGCSLVPPQSASGYSHRFSQPAADAARCFAANAEAHSSALIAEVSGERGRYEVVVRVKNGALYAVARIAPAATHATGVIELNVQSSEGNQQLVDRLVAGC